MPRGTADLLHTAIRPSDVLLRAISGGEPRQRVVAASATEWCERAFARRGMGVPPMFFILYNRRGSPAPSMSASFAIRLLQFHRHVLQPGVLHPIPECRVAAVAVKNADITMSLRTAPGCRMATCSAIVPPLLKPKRSACLMRRVSRSATVSSADCTKLNGRPAMRPCVRNPVARTRRRGVLCGQVKTGSR